MTPLKFLLVFLVLVLTSEASNGQYLLSSTTTLYTEVFGGEDLNEIETDDAMSGEVDLGFDFNFIGQSFNTVRISSNGFITLDGVTDDAASNVIGAGSTFIRLIAPLWDDLNGDEGQAFVATTGPAGSRIFTCEWRNWKWAYDATAPSISFQVRLYESNGKIEFSYRQEAGVVLGGSASIGIIGHSPDIFYSLSDSGTQPDLHPNGFNSISQRPASHQLYSFEAPFLVIPVVAPDENIGALEISAATAGSFHVAWAELPGANVAVFAREENSISTFAAEDLIYYAASASFGASLANAGNGWFCVYNGSGNSFTLSGLKSGFAYSIHAVAYNGTNAEQHYNAGQGLSNPVTSATPLVGPAEDVPITAVYRNSSEINLTIGNHDGAFIAIFGKANETGLALPDNTQGYAGSAEFGTGSQIGTTGWFCLYSGPKINTLSITNLNAGEQYNFHAINFNGHNGAFAYNANSNGAVSATTLADLPVDYSFSSQPQSFLALSGGTPIDTIEADDELSAAIPLTFPFYFDGDAFTQVFVSSNGLLSFSPYANFHGAQHENDISHALIRPAIAPLWDDLSGVGGQASYQVSGTAPNRVFVVEFLNWKWNYAAQDQQISFQVKLYEGDGKIAFAYRQEAGTPILPSASIGLAFAELNNFISLTDVSAAPATSTVSETSSINARPASDQLYTFTPSRLDQMIQFDPLLPVEFANPSPIVVLHAQADSGLPISYAPSDLSIATISGNTLTIHKAGSVSITATQSGNSVYNNAPDQVQVLTVLKGNQTIAFAALPPKVYGDAPFALNASSSSGLPVTFESSDLTIATINANQVTIVGAGTISMTAKQLGDLNFHEAPQQVRDITISKKTQQISFDVLPAKILGDQPFELVVSSSSGLPVSLSSSAPGVATISGNTVTLLARGITTIKATQAGDNYFNAAAAIEHILTVRGTQQISFPQVPDKTVTDQNFFLTPIATSALPVELSTSSNTIMLNGFEVQILAPGPATIKAIQPGNDSFTPAPIAEITFCIKAMKPSTEVSGLGTDAPVLTSSAPAHNQWFRDGMLIAGATSPSITATQAGSYSVSVIVGGCASEQSDPEVLLVTDVAEEKLHVRVFPNPAANIITIDVSGQDFERNSSLQIVDNQGQSVLESEIHRVRHLDVSKLKPGVYIIRIAREQTVIIKEFLKN